MKKILLKAPVLTGSGYGTHARQVARWLMSRQDVEARVELLPWGDTSWIVSDSDPVVRWARAHSEPFKEKPNVSIQLQLPSEWDPTCAPVNVGMSAIVETDRCHKSWVE